MLMVSSYNSYTYNSCFVYWIFEVTTISLVCHAELNAVLNTNCSDIRGCTMYVGLFPCNECAKVIIQANIKEVIYMSDKHAHKPSTMAAKKMFEAAGVSFK